MTQGSYKSVSGRTGGRAYLSRSHRNTDLAGSALTYQQYTAEIAPALGPHSIGTTNGLTGGEPRRARTGRHVGLAARRRRRRLICTRQRWRDPCAGKVLRRSRNKAREFSLSSSEPNKVPVPHALRMQDPLPPSRARCHGERLIYTSQNKDIISAERGRGMSDAEGVQKQSTKGLFAGFPCTWTLHQSAHGGRQNNYAHQNRTRSMSRFNM